MIDFTNLPVRNKTYAGANGSKISVVYDGELYMLKFPAVPIINKEMSYANGCISEYLGWQILESIGIPVQKTLLGTYTKNGKQAQEASGGKPRKIVAFCACNGKFLYRSCSCWIRGFPWRMPTC